MSYSNINDFVGTSVPSAKSLRNGEYADSCGQKGGKNHFNR